MDKTICVIFMCLIGVAFAAVIENAKPIESNAAAVADQIAPEDKKSSDDDLETAEFKHFRRKFVPVAVPVAPIYVQPVQPIPVHVPVQPVHYQPVPYHQHVHTPDCGCNNGGGHNSYGYNYNYHYSYKK